MTEGPVMLVYTIAPDNTALWLQGWLAARIGAEEGDRLTVDQYESEHIQEELAIRRSLKKGRRRFSI